MNLFWFILVGIPSKSELILDLKCTWTQLVTVAMAVVPATEEAEAGGLLWAQESEASLGGIPRFHLLNSVVDQPSDDMGLCQHGCTGPSEAILTMDPNNHTAPSNPLGCRFRGPLPFQNFLFSPIILKTLPSWSPGFISTATVRRPYHYSPLSTGACMIHPQSAPTTVKSTQPRIVKRSLHTL